MLVLITLWNGLLQIQIFSCWTYNIDDGYSLWSWTHPLLWLFWLFANFSLSTFVSVNSSSLDLSVNLKYFSESSSLVCWSQSLFRSSLLQRHPHPYLNVLSLFSCAYFLGTEMTFSHLMGFVGRKVECTLCLGQRYLQDPGDLCLVCLDCLRALQVLFYAWFHSHLVELHLRNWPLRLDFVLQRRAYEEHPLSLQVNFE